MMAKIVNGKKVTCPPDEWVCKSGDRVNHNNCILQPVKPDPGDACRDCNIPCAGTLMPEGCPAKNKLSDPGRDYPEGKGECFVRVRANDWLQKEESRKYHKEENKKLRDRIRELEDEQALHDKAIDGMILEADRLRAKLKEANMASMSDSPALTELRIELGNVVHRLKEQDERITALEARPYLEAGPEAVSVASDHIEYKPGNGPDLDPGWRKGADRIDHRDIQGIMADKAEPEWPEVKIIPVRNGYDTAVVTGADDHLTRAEAEAVKRAYDEIKRQASGKVQVLYLNLRSRKEVMDYAIRILKGLEE